MSRGSFNIHLIWVAKGINTCNDLQCVGNKNCPSKHTGHTTSRCLNIVVESEADSLYQYCVSHDLFYYEIRERVGRGSVSHCRSCLDLSAVMVKHTQYYRHYIRFNSLTTRRNQALNCSYSIASSIRI